MTEKQVNELLERIKANYQTFSVTPNKILEWHRVLSNYDVKDVNNAYDEYMETHENAPMIFSLTNGLKKKEEKIEKTYLMKCEYCGQMMWTGYDMKNFLEHERKCMKIDFIDMMSKRLRNKPISVVKYYEMEDKELDEAYHKIMNYYLEHKKEEQNILKTMPSEV